MRYAGIIKNDIAAAPGVCLSFFTQGCPHRCFGCHNPQTWDFGGGKEFTVETIAEILNGLYANGILRNLCIMGGEPMCHENIPLVETVISAARKAYPDIKVYVWTGYLIEELMSNPEADGILKMVDCIVDGPFIMSKRDTTLFMRGSSNQRIIYMKDGAIERCET